MEGSASNTISSRDDEITRKQSELGTEKDSSIDVLSEEATVKSDDDQANETTCPVCLEQIGTSPYMLLVRMSRVTISLALCILDESLSLTNLCFKRCERDRCVWHFVQPRLSSTLHP